LYGTWAWQSLNTMDAASSQISARDQQAALAHTSAVTLDGHKATVTAFYGLMFNQS